MQTSILKKMLPYLVGAVAVYYSVPMLTAAAGSDWGFLLTLLGLLVLNPLYAFLSSLLFCAKNGFRWYYPVLLGLLFIPVIFIYYNSSAIVYFLVYTAIAFVGSGAVLLVRYLGSHKQ